MRHCFHYPSQAEDGCDICRRYDTDDPPGYRAFSDQTAVKLRPSIRAPLPCVHVGPDSGPKGWHYCEHESTPLGDIVCDCKGCGPSCPGYKARPASAILLTGGLGDVFAVEAMMTPAQREAVETLYIAAPARRQIESLFRALPQSVFPRLRNYLLVPEPTVFFERAEVEAVVGPLPGVEDWSIRVVFPLKLPYLGSSFLDHKLADVTPPAERYAIIAPASGWGQWPNRNFDQRDWRVVIQSLEATDLVGVVIGTEAAPVPPHPRLVDWQCRTDILESVELMKGAEGYIGIDSWPSVLAAKLYLSPRISVKCVWHHAQRWRDVYFAPREEFDFLQRRLTPWSV